MSAAAQPDFTPIRKRFVAGLDDRMIRITEYFLTLEREPSRRLVETLLRELHSLAGTAGTLGFGTLSVTAASAEQTCLRMIERSRNGPYDRGQDLIELERYLILIGHSVASAEG